jgi:transglutaminase-like putative cysteine protease
MSSAETTITSETSTRPYKWDWFVAVLLIGMLQSVSGRLVATEWVNDLQITLALSLIGSVLGLALGVSRFSPLLVTFFATAYGFFSITWQLGLILGRGVQWVERLVSLWGRLSLAIESLIGKKNVTDPLLFLFIVCIIVWFVCVFAGVTLVRQFHPWRVVLPGGIAIMIINAYSYQDDVSARFLAFYVFMILLLVARMYYLDRQEKWQEIHISVPFHISFDLISGAVLIAGLLVIFAWNTPTVIERFAEAEETWDSLTSPLKEATEGMDNIFAALKSSVGLVSVGGVRGYYGDDIPLGSGIPQADDLILSVEAPINPTPGVNYYWRARFYDRYQDGRWENTKLDSQFINPDEYQISFPTYDSNYDTTFKFTIKIPLSTLYSPPQPLWISRPVELETQSTEEDDVEIVAFHASPSLLAGEVYEVEVSRTDATITELRSAGEDYPQWVVKKYLQVPDSITERTFTLVDRIAEGSTTPYDKAVAVTNYLRDNIEYVDTISDPPDDVDPVEWMLFDSHQGFCNYYSTAEVILLRSLGIPARFSAGYSQGEAALEEVGRPALGGNIGEEPGDLIETGGDQITYLVRAKNLHSWPEVYFPGYGWIEFEPTVNQRPLVRPLDDTEIGQNRLQDQSNYNGNLPLEDDQFPEPESNLPEEAWTPPEEHLSLFAIFIVVVVLLGTPLGIWYLLRSYLGLSPVPVLIENRLIKMDITPPSFLNKWARWTTLSAMEKSYHAINRSLRILGESQMPAISPKGRAIKLVSLLPSISDEINELLGTYQDWCYGGQLVNIKKTKQLARKIQLQAVLEKIRGKNF